MHLQCSLFSDFISINLMSEYQYYRFERQEGLLSASQKNDLRQISSRAEISASHFSVVYNYGNLKASPDELMAEYFDIGFYFANWGSADSYIKLPQGTIPDAFLGFEDDETAVCIQRSKHQLLMYSLEPNDECRYWYMEEEERDEFVEHLTSLRQELLQGDFRVLYLHWLKGVVDGNCSLENMPLVDFDFNNLSDAQLAFMEIYEIPHYACRALSMVLSSEPSHSREGNVLSAEEQLARLSEENKDLLLHTLFEQGNLSVNEARLLLDDAPEEQSYEYWLTPEKLKAFLPVAESELKAEKMQAEQARLEQERLAALNRLNTIFKEKEAYWSKLQSDADTQSGVSYDRAVTKIKELHAAYITNNSLDEFVSRYREFVKANIKRKSLFKRFEPTHSQLMADY